MNVPAEYSAPPPPAETPTPSFFLAQRVEIFLTRHARLVNLFRLVMRRRQFNRVRKSRLRRVARFPRFQRKHQTGSLEMTWPVRPERWSTGSAALLFDLLHGPLQLLAGRLAGQQARAGTAAQQKQ